MDYLKWFSRNYHVAVPYSRDSIHIMKTPDFSSTTEYLQNMSGGFFLHFSMQYIMAYYCAPLPIFCHYTSCWALFYSSCRPRVRSFCHFSRQQRDGKQASSAFPSTASAICPFILQRLPQAEPVKTIKTAMSNVSWSTMSTYSHSNTNSASTSSSGGGVPPIPNPIRGHPIEGGASLGPIAALEQSAAMLNQRAVQA